MPRRNRNRVWVKALTAEAKGEIAAVCGKFIADTLKPRFLPEIRPTEFNFPVDVFGRWRGSKYSFIVRYRSGFAENSGEAFNSAFARLDHVAEHFSETRFDVMWHRHTGQWYRLYDSVTLKDALRCIETDGLLHPP